MKRRDFLWRRANRMAGCAHVARALRIGVIARRVRPSVRSYTRGQVLLQFHPAHMAKTTRPRPAAAGAFLSSCSPKKVTAEGTIEASGAGCWVHRHLHREVRLPLRTRRTRKGHVGLLRRPPAPAISGMFKYKTTLRAHRRAMTSGWMRSAALVASGVLLLACSR